MSEKLKSPTCRECAMARGLRVPGERLAAAWRARSPGGLGLMTSESLKEAVVRIMCGRIGVPHPDSAVYAAAAALLSTLRNSGSGNE